MSIYVCDRCDHYRDNDLIPCFEEREQLVCEYCLEEHEGYGDEIDLDAYFDEVAA